MRFAALLLIVACGSHTPPSAPAPAPAPVPAPPLVVAPVGSAQPARLTCVASKIAALRDDGSFSFGSHRVEVGREVCDPADDNLARVEGALLALKPGAPHTASPVEHPRAVPVGLDLIERRFALTVADRAHLERDNFVVAGRLAQPSYAWAYHEIYQSQLPVFVSVDSILHALYAAHEHLVARLERDELYPELVAMLSKLSCALATANLPKETARDLDLYLTVARSLLEATAIPSALGGVDAAAATLVAAATIAGPMQTVELFGRARVIDFSQYQPRSHYAGTLAPYFRAFMWLSRLELNLVSRSSRSSAPALDATETPREELDALGLAELVQTAGEADRLAAIDAKLAVLAGRREDLSIAQLHGFAIDPRTADAADQLRAAIGTKFQRSARIHFMPEGSSTLPAIATLLGPRIVADTSAMRPLVHSEVPDRDRVRAGDLAYLVGNARGKKYLAEDLARFPSLAVQLDKAREALQLAPHTPDLYTAWLDTIRALATDPAGAHPTFMTTQAYADLRLDSTLAAYAQLRHDHVLIAGQAYGEGGCVIPDGYVEPAPDVYDAIARYAELGGKTLGGAYWARLGKLARVLAQISRIELANQPLPLEARQWLSMVTEITPYGSDGRPGYTGWYFDLFEDRGDAIGAPDLVADYFTSGTGRVAYVGTRAPTMGIFIVDTGGPRRAMIGPIAHAYEYASNATPRLTDVTARDVETIEDPWTASYLVPAPPEPTFFATPSYAWVGEDQYVVVEIETKQRLGKVTIDGVDHHRVPVTKSVTQTVGPGHTTIRLMKNPPELGLVHVRIGDFQAWLEFRCMDGCRGNGFGKDRNVPPPEQAE